MKRIKQIAAIISIILLVSMYVLTLVFAIFDRTETMALLKTSVYCSIMIPVFLYAFLLITKLVKGKGIENNEAVDTMPENTDSEAGEE